MDNQAKDLKLEKDEARLSHTRKEKNAKWELKMQEKKKANRT